MKAADLDLLHLLYCTSQFLIIAVSLSVTVYCKHHSRMNSGPLPFEKVLSLLDLLSRRQK